MKKNIIIGVVALVALLFIAILLNKSAPTPADSVSDGVKADVVSLPADFSVFPLSPQAKITSVQDTDGESARDASVSLVTTESREEIYAWYRNALSTNGWHIKSDKNIGGYQIIQAENENLYTSLQVASGNNPGEMIISQHLKIRK